METGRTHQIRVHMSKNGHPIVGDKTYGVKRKNLIWRDSCSMRIRLGLYTRYQENIWVVSELPDYYMNDA